jgi:enamine deaminase RidA (YjgF/YER057c/UK114 family)
MGERRRARSGAELEGRYGYCRAVAAGDRIVVSGTAPIWPGGECDPDPEAQARRCCEIIVAALEELGAGAADVVRTRMFITDPAISEIVGKVHGECFGDAEPATTMVVVAALLDPRWLVEIEAEAYRRTDR